MSHRPGHRIRRALTLRQILRTYRGHRLRPPRKGLTAEVRSTPETVAAALRTEVVEELVRRTVAAAEGNHRTAEDREDSQMAADAKARRIKQKEK